MRFVLAVLDCSVPNASEYLLYCHVISNDLKGESGEVVQRSERLHIFRKVYAAVNIKDGFILSLQLYIPRYRTLGVVLNELLIMSKQFIAAPNVSKEKNLKLTILSSGSLLSVLSKKCPQVQEFRSFL